VTIRTRRGNLRVAPDGTIEGLWQIIRRELRTKAEVRSMCGFRQRHTLIRWMQDPRDPFPPPVLMKDASGGVVEFWSRTAVEAWLRRTEGRRRPAKRPA
jgi:predicted DNA-binding transcriptional regulator AlpA